LDKRPSDVLETKEAVTLEEIQAIAVCVSLPIQAMDIRNRKVIRYPGLGVRTKKESMELPIC
jgi:hypothetical protein